MEEVRHWSFVGDNEKKLKSGPCYFCYETGFFKTLNHIISIIPQTQLAATTHVTYQWPTWKPVLFFCITCYQVSSDIHCILHKKVEHSCIHPVHLYYMHTIWEVCKEKNCAPCFEYSPRAKAEVCILTSDGTHVVFPIQTDQGWQITC